MRVRAKQLGVSAANYVRGLMREDCAKLDPETGRRVTGFGHIVNIFLNRPTEPGDQT